MPLKTKKIKKEKSIAKVSNKNESIKFSTAILSESFKSKSGKVLKNKVKVKGTALKARISRNNVKYEIDQMIKAKDTLIGKSIAANHSDDVEDIIGKVEATMIKGSKLLYEADIYNTAQHPDIVQKIQKGLINKVSIEAIPKGEPTVDEDGVVHVEGFEFIGLGVVRHEGIPEASVAIAEAFKIKKGEKEEQENLNMETKKVKAPKKEVKQETVKTESLGLKKENEAMKQDLLAVKEQLKELTEKLESQAKASTKGITKEAKAKKEVVIAKSVEESAGADFIMEGHGDKVSFFAVEPNY